MKIPIKITDVLNLNKIPSKYKILSDYLTKISVQSQTVRC